MRPNPKHAVDDPAFVRDLVAQEGFATIVSSTSTGPAASHYPVVLDTAAAERGELVVLTHLGRPDERIHELDAAASEGREVLVIVQGPHGYVSPSWYSPGASKAPTWNFTVAHLWGVPEVLTPEENLETLVTLVAHFEQHVDEPMWLDRAWGAPVARGTVGLRIPVSRFEVKAKLSQDKDAQSVQNVIDHLRAPGPYSHPALADDMERARDDD
ncbi:FMN-binding negative transcriptional regulator [Aeromicrobium sp. Leaf350]|uniref:FMN-binding negative transcriptional regulator n=1 Tax=Aeromicrobium sp. Leaf350 TaxID=2876565 RepID=UPI001E472C62|nr:FMN-binding negative transcriptional regulator [Aeromicrobium sp. Leaf350]